MLDAVDAVATETEVDDVAHARQRTEALQCVVTEVQSHGGCRQTARQLSEGGLFTRYCQRRRTIVDSIILSGPLLSHTNVTFIYYHSYCYQPGW